MWNIFKNKKKKELGGDYENVIMSKSEKSIKCNITVCLKDDEYTAEHLNDDKNIIAFISCNPKNIENADFYYLLFTNKQIIKIIYENENDRLYNTVITQIKLIDENTLRIYYTVINI
jgi:hypothetical protein